MKQRDRVYAAIARLVSRPPAPSVGYPVHLGLAEDRVFSQNGEDGVLEALLDALEARGADVPQFFVEFGAGDGEECNTRYLAQVLGWPGRMIEGDEERYDRLEERWRHATGVETVHRHITTDNVVESCLNPNHQRSHQLGVLSIDVDGQDYWLFQELLSMGIRPMVAVVEVNPAAARDAVEPLGSPPWDGYSRTFGAHPAAMAEMAAHYGYTMVHIEMAGVNAFFVPQEYAHRFEGVLDRSPDWPES